MRGSREPRQENSGRSRHTRFAALAAFLGVIGSTGSATGYSGEVYTVCRLNPDGDNYLSLRDCPSSSCPELLRLGPGTFLWTTEPFSEQGWRPVIVMRDINDEYPVNRPSGYVFDRYICRVDFRS